MALTVDGLDNVRRKRSLSIIFPVKDSISRPRSHQSHTTIQSAMSSIGPQIPPHLLAQFQRPDNDSDNDVDDDSGPQPNALAGNIGPEFPTHVVEDAEPRPVIGPALPTVSKGSKEDNRGIAPSTSKPPSVSGSAYSATPGNAAGKRLVGPPFPIRSSTYDSDDDDDIGPKPLAAGHYEKPDPVKEFMEKEERRRKAAEVLWILIHL